MLIVKQEHIEVGGVRLHLRHAGDGELLLFLHGFPESSLTWAKQIQEFSSRYHTVAPDGRGFGQSDILPSRDDYRIKRLVGDVLAVADHFGAERFTLIGHDWGGVVAWIAAAWHPDRIARLVIVNAPHPTLFQARLEEDPAQRAASAYIGRLTTGEVPPADALWTAIFTDTEKRGLIDEAERAELLTAWQRPGAVEAMLNWYRAAPFDFSCVGGTGAGTLPRPLRVDVPTLVIWGLDDKVLLPSLLDGLDALVPDLTVATFADAGHAILREQPERVMARIADYLVTRSR